MESYYVKYGALIVAMALLVLSSPVTADDEPCKCKETWMDKSGDCANTPVEQKGCPSLEALRRCNSTAVIRECESTKMPCKGIYTDNNKYQHCNIVDPKQRNVLAKIRTGDDQKCMLVKHNTQVNDTEIFDLTPLQKFDTPGVGSWLDSNWHSEKSGKSGHDDKEYAINICAPLVNRCDDCVAPDAVREADMTNADSGNHVLGRFTVNSTIQSMHNGDLRIELPDGDAAQHQTDGVCPTRKTLILFFCDDGLGTPNFADEFYTCEYVFVWNTCAACPLGHPFRENNCGPGTDSTETASVFGTTFQAVSPASAILIVCSICLSVYLLGGCAYNRFVTGARGWDQMPNNSFWSSLCGSVAAGPVALCNAITGRKSVSNISFQTQYKGGLLDDDDDVDEDAEDHT